MAHDLLGKYLVFNSPKGIVSGMIIEDEAYPAFIDNVSHGNKRTKRTEVIYQVGGYAYVYFNYGLHFMLNIVVNNKDVPECVLIRRLIPDQGIDIMMQNFGREVEDVKQLTRSPGNLCKSFGIALQHYGTDLTDNLLFIEDRGIEVDPEQIKTGERVGIDPKVKGSELKLRYSILDPDLDNKHIPK